MLVEGLQHATTGDHIPPPFSALPEVGLLGGVEDGGSKAACAKEP